LRRHLDVAFTLVNELVQAAFDIRLEDVSMLVLIRDEQVRALITDAEAKAGEGAIIDGLVRLRMAFDLAIQEYESRKTLNGWSSIFTTKPSLFPNTFDFEKLGGHDGRRHLDKVVEWIGHLDERLRLATHGVDLQRFAYFDAVASKVWYLASDHPSIPRVRFEDVTLEHFRSSHLFVVDTAIRLAARDYTLVESRRLVDRRRHFDPEYVPNRSHHDSHVSPAD
jgi:hypothetical protein